MSYHCQHPQHKGSRVIPEGIASNKLVTETRPRQYTRGEYTGKEHDTRVVAVSTEIAKEIVVCPTCFEQASK